MRETSKPMNDLRTQAEIFAVGLEFGLIDVSEVVVWADRNIESLDDPPLALLDVSMASRANNLDVANFLRQLTGEPNSDDLLRGIIRMVSDSLRTERRTPEEIARLLFLMALDETLPDGDLRKHAYGFDDAFDLAAAGYIEESREELIVQMHAVLDRWLAEQPHSQIYD
jgi:hypothetical protein